MCAMYIFSDILLTYNFQWTFIFILSSEDLPECIIIIIIIIIITIIMMMITIIIVILLTQCTKNWKRDLLLFRSATPLSFAR